MGSASAGMRIRPGRNCNPIASYLELMISAARVVKKILQ